MEGTQRHKADIGSLSSDLLCAIFAQCHRRDAARAACTCTAWRQTVSSMTTEQRWPFVPRLFIGCSRSCEVVEVTDLLPGNRFPVSELPVAHHTPEGQSVKRKRGAEPSWATSVAMSPYGSRALHVCQYDVMGVTRHNGRSLAPLGRLVWHEMLREPEGVTFAHGHMYVQNNWGQVVRCSLDGQVIDRMYVGGELVTWAVVAGPDGHLYVSADVQYTTEAYVDVPAEATGRIMQARLDTDGRFLAPPTPYTQTPMKRPCGLRWGPACGTLFVTCLDPAVMRFAGPSHPKPGSLLSRISLSACPNLLPWDVEVLCGHTLVVSMHRRRSTQAPTRPRVKSRARPAPAAGSSSQRANPGPSSSRSTGHESRLLDAAVIPVHLSTHTTTDHEQGAYTASTATHLVTQPTTKHQGAATSNTTGTSAAASAAQGSPQMAVAGGPASVPNTVSVSVHTATASVAADVSVETVGGGYVPERPLDPDRSHLLIIPELGSGWPTVLQLPFWMDHANMMCSEQ